MRDANILVVGDSDMKKMPADKVSQSKPMVMVLSGMLDEKSAVETAVETAAGWFGTYCGKTVKDDDTVYNCDYSVEVNAMKVTNDSLTNESAWVISFVVNQKVTKAANVQV